MITSLQPIKRALVLYWVYHSPLVSTKSIFYVCWRMWGQYKNAQTLDSNNFHNFNRSQQHAKTWKWVVKFVLDLKGKIKVFLVHWKVTASTFSKASQFYLLEASKLFMKLYQRFFKLTVLSKTFMDTFIKILTVLGQIRTLSSVHEWAGCRNIGSIHNFSKWHLFKFQKAHFIPSTQQTLKHFSSCNQTKVTLVVTIEVRA